MMKILFLFITTLFLQFSYAQTKQGTLIENAHYFSRTRDYAKSIQLLKQALKSPSNISDDYNYAVKVALRNNDQQLAFKWLDDYTKIDNYRSIDDIQSDSTLLKLHSSPKWQKFISNLTNRNRQSEEKYNQQLKKELDQIYFDDQDVRIKYLEEWEKANPKNTILDSLMKIMITVDSANIIKVSSILDRYGWLNSKQVGEKGNTSLFGVIQHANLKTKQKYLPLIVKAFKNGDLPAVLYAQFVDRVKSRETGKQIYGTQYGWTPNSNKTYILPMIDPDNVDKRRFEIGLGHFSYYLQGQGLVWNLEEYKRNLPVYEKWASSIHY